MAYPDQFSDIKDLDELSHFIDRYCIEFMVPDCKFDPIIQIIMDSDHYTITKLSSEELSAYAFKLHAYCIFLRKELDKTISKAAWCEEIINKVVARSWESFNSYMKYEVRRHAAIEQDTFAVKVEKARMFFVAASQQTQHKVYSVSKMADVLENLAKKKSYDHK